MRKLSRRDATRHGDGNILEDVLDSRWCFHWKWRPKNQLSILRTAWSKMTVAREPTALLRPIVGNSAHPFIRALQSSISSVVSHLSSHLSSLISHFSSLISHLSFVLSYLSSVLCPLSSLISHLTSHYVHRTICLSRGQAPCHHRRGWNWWSYTCPALGTCRCFLCCTGKDLIHQTTG